MILFVPPNEHKLGDKLIINTIMITVSLPANYSLFFPSLV